MKIRISVEKIFRTIKYTRTCRACLCLCFVLLVSHILFLIFSFILFVVASKTLPTCLSIDQNFKRSVETTNLARVGACCFPHLRVKDCITCIFVFDSKHLGCQKFLCTLRFVTHYRIKCVRHTYHICSDPSDTQSQTETANELRNSVTSTPIHWIVLCSNVMISRTHPVSCKIFYIAQSSHSPLSLSMCHSLHEHRGLYCCSVRMSCRTSLYCTKITNTVTIQRSGV